MLLFIKSYVKCGVIMPEKGKDFYTSAHLFVAAIRVCEHRSSVPPSLEEICKTLSFSMERGHFICRKLKELEIIDVVEGSFDNRLFIQNHLKLEDIPQGKEESKLEGELKKFQNAQKVFSKKIELFQAEQSEKKRNLFAEMEKKAETGN